MIHWYVTVLKKYAVFEGRARRKEYWYFTLGNCLLALAAGILDGMAGHPGGGIFGLLFGVYCLGILIPSIAVSVRRMHDTGRSGWWVLINFVPVIGVFIFIVLAVFDSEPGTNAYGPNPKEGEDPGVPMPPPPPA